MSSEPETHTHRRPDLSQFLVHLTKGNGNTPADRRENARQKLAGILTPTINGMCQLNGNPVGLFIKAAENDDKLKSLITAVSFSETPLEYINQLTPNYSEYGVVFTKEFVRSRNGNPAFYISTAHTDSLRKAVLDLIRVEGYESRKMALLLPFFTQFGKTSGGWEMDYHYEREWRVPQSLEFHHEDIFVGLCQDQSDIDFFSGRFSEVPFVCPSWSIDMKMAYLRKWKSPTDRQVVYEECLYGRYGVCPLH